MSHFERETDRQAQQANKSSARASQTTAYQSNTRESCNRTIVQYAQNDKIKSLLENDYAFLPLSYRAPGFLFRGLDSGINDGIRKGEFALNEGSHSLAALERELGVVLVSADFSDALSVSRLWEGHDDGGILVIPASTFDKHYIQHNAATLGFAEPGVVFKYPFFTNPIPINDIAYLIVHQKQADKLVNAANDARPPVDASNNPATSGDISDRLIVIDDDNSLAKRGNLNEYLNECLANKSVSKATAIQVEKYPRK